MQDLHVEDTAKVAVLARELAKHLLEQEQEEMMKKRVETLGKILGHVGSSALVDAITAVEGLAATRKKDAIGTFVGVRELVGMLVKNSTVRIEEIKERLEDFGEASASVRALLEEQAR